MGLFTRATKFLGWLAALSLVTACSTTGERAAETTAAAPMDSLVTAEWLAAELDEPDLVVLDCTVLIEQTEDGHFGPTNGRPSYEAGHIPTAGFADLMGDLSDPDSPLEFALPTPEAFAAAMGELGVGDDSRVVLYDANRSVWAARVWWMLRWIGFDRAAVLDGGLEAWTAAGRPLSTAPATRSARVLTPRVRPELIADRDEVFAALSDEDVVLIDAMPAPHYRGEMTMYGRPGHIPGAENVPVSTMVDEAGRYRSPDELAALFEADRDERVITYCGGGIAASASAFILTRLGYPDVAVYDASLQEWAADPANPLEVVDVFEEFDREE
jgi:thiosulfate/3-mercaptopyruvate sulfurtransferase